MQKSKTTFRLIAIPISLFLFNCRQPMSCDKIKNGKFFYYSKLNRSKILIERIDSLQIETDVKNNSILRSKIGWQNDCKFQIFVNALSNTKFTKQDSLLATNASTIEITHVTPYFYICIAKFSTSKKNYEFIDTMYMQK